LLFLLASASDNSGFFGRYYTGLLGLNATVAFLLLILVLVALGRLYARYKAKRFGSRLMARLVLLFAGIGILPGLVIFMVSVQFASHSIESWFDVKIEAALQSGLNLGHAALDEALAELSAKSQTVAATLSGQDDSGAQLALSQLVSDTEGMQSALLLDAGGKLVASASEDRRADLTADLPNPQMVRQAAMPGGYARAEGGIELDFRDNSNGANGANSTGLDAVTGLRLRVVMTVPEPPGAAPRYLQLMQTVPVNLASNAEVLRGAFSEYQQRSVARKGLRQMYVGTLTLTLLLAIFGAIGSAVLIAGNLAQPLLVLAEGTQAVAEGDLSPRPIVETSDELGTLTQSFNAMTGQLFEARSAVERNRAALQSAKAHLESVLANMSAGVLVLDAEGTVVNSNEAACRILQMEQGHLTGPLSKIEGLEAFAATVTRAFSTQSAQSAAGTARQRTHWQQEIEIPRRAPGEDHDTTLLARGSRLPVGVGRGRAAPRARDQEPADADPALGRTPADETRRQARAGRRGPAGARDDHHRQPGRRHEAHGRRLPRLCAHAAGGARTARPECPDPGNPDAVPGRGCLGRDPYDAGAEPATRDGRPDPAAPGDPQPAAKRPGCAGRPRPGCHGAPHRRGHRDHPLHRRRRHGGRGRAPGDPRQRPWLCAENPGARLRTLRDLEGTRHGTGLADGEKDHRRARWTHRCPEPSGWKWRVGIHFAVKVSTRGELG
jgi:HAMP domain-containing protein